MKFENREFFAIFLFLFHANGCYSCFTHNKTNAIGVETGRPFFHKCHCDLLEYTVNDLKWLDPRGKEIQLLGPDTKSMIFTEAKSRSINLYIPSISKSASGAYKCVTSHDGRHFEYTVNVQAYDPPFFVNTEYKQFLVKDRDSQIKCEVRADTNLLITWYKEEAEFVRLNNGDKYEIEPEGLKIKNVQNDDKGKYKCTATVLNTGDEVDRVIDVEVTTFPHVEEIEVKPNKTVIIGDPLILECKVMGIPFPDVQFQKETDKKFHLIETNGTNKIHIESTKAEDRGVYRCNASNKAGMDSKSVKVEVLIPPKIEEFDNVTSSEGFPAQITCKASGRPIPTINVRFLGEEYFEDPSISKELKSTNATESIYIWTFYSMNRSYSGMYVCEAQNDVGLVSESSVLDVLYKPYFNEPTEHVWGWDGKILNLSCLCESNPPARLQWRFMYRSIYAEIENLLDNYDDDVITINFKERPMYGTFECIASNEIGIASKTITLEEGHAPPAVNNVSIKEEELTATSITFSIEGPDSFRGPPVIGFTCEYDESENYNRVSIHWNRTWSVDRPYRIDKLKRNTTYIFKFAAINEVGTGNWTEPIEFRMPDKSVPDRPIWSEDTISLISQTPGKNSKIIKWEYIENNGDPIDYYVLKYCALNVGDPKAELCNITRLVPQLTQVDLSDNLRKNTTYYLELIAHNSEGNSSAAELIVTTPVMYGPRLRKPITTLTAEAIIGVSAIVVIAFILLLDVLLFYWKRQGMIATCYNRKAKKRKQGYTVSKDKKGLLKENSDPSTKGGCLRKARNGEEKHDYTKTTGVITGKHSSV